MLIVIKVDPYAGFQVIVLIVVFDATLWNYINQIFERAVCFSGFLMLHFTPEAF